MLTRNPVSVAPSPVPSSALRVLLPFLASVKCPVAKSRPAHASRTVIGSDHGSGNSGSPTRDPMNMTR